MFPSIPKHQISIDFRVSYMAPTPAKIEKALAQGVREIWASDARDSLTVNNVRRDVEEKLGLAEGFLADGDWKVKSKAIVHKEVVSACPGFAMPSNYCLMCSCCNPGGLTEYTRTGPVRKRGALIVPHEAELACQTPQTEEDNEKKTVIRNQSPAQEAPEEKPLSRRGI